MSAGDAAVASAAGPRVKRSAWIVLALAGTLLNIGSGCAPATLTKERLNEVVEARREARGAWIVVRSRPREEPPRLAGELLAATPDSIHVLTGRGVVSFAGTDLRRTEVMLYEAPRQVSKLPMLYLGPSAAKSPSELSRHARFPQGLPPGFDRDTRTSP